MRGPVEVETLLRALLVLAVIWLALEVLELFVETLQFVPAPLPKVIGLLTVLIVLHLLDRI
jgi:hypothetical protein